MQMNAGIRTVELLCSKGGDVDHSTKPQEPDNMTFAVISTTFKAICTELKYQPASDCLTGSETGFLFRPKGEL
jgi:hypothetical protein